MNLYLLTRNDEVDYDQYDSILLAYDTEEEARKEAVRINPNIYPEDVYSGFKTDNFAIKIIGVAAEDVEPGCVIGSFNAG